MWIEIILALDYIRLVPVTPYAGVWIEITSKAAETFINNVTPYAGVWIEISYILYL